MLLIEKGHAAGPSGLAPGLRGAELVEAVATTANASMTDECEAFLSRRISLDCDKKIIHVIQGEYAMVRLHKEPRGIAYVSSSDATTCLVVVLRSPRAALVAHLDTGCCEGVEELLRRMRAAEEREVGEADQGHWEVCLLGSYREPSGVGFTVLTHVLEACHAWPEPLHLVLACVLDANTDAATGGPRSRDLIMHLDSGTAYSGTILDRGPEIACRLASGWLRGWQQGGEEEEGGRSIPVPVYDPETTEVVVRGLPSVPSAAMVQRFRALQRLEDRQLLAVTSTSPEHEGPCFVAGTISPNCCSVPPTICYSSTITQPA